MVHCVLCSRRQYENAPSRIIYNYLYLSRYTISVHIKILLNKYLIKWLEIIMINIYGLYKISFSSFKINVLYFLSILGLKKLQHTFGSNTCLLFRPFRISIVLTLIMSSYFKTVWRLPTVILHGNVPSW